MKRIIFWIGFIVVLLLIIWGLVVAQNKNSISKVAELKFPVTVEDHIFGPENAPVTIVEYSDFQCPACGMYFPLVEKLVHEASTTVRLVYRHFPLTQHIHAETAARASEAAALQGKFWEMYRKIFDGQLDWENLKTTAESALVYEKYAKEIGLDLAKYNADINSPAIIQKVKDSAENSIKSGINSTPTFFINGKAITNPQGYEAFKQIIEAAVKESTK